MNVRPVRPDDKDALVPLIAQFRVTLAQFRGRSPAIDLEAARAELTDYLRQDFPNNNGIISFLRTRGYNVLNLIEIRRPRPGEQPLQKVNVGRHVFDH